MPTPKQFLAFEVFINGERQFLAGHAAHTVLSANLTWGAAADGETILHVGGLTAARAGKHTYTAWCPKACPEPYQLLRPGDEVRIRIRKVAKADPVDRRDTQAVESDREARKRRYLQLKAEFEPKHSTKRRTKR